MINRTSSPKLRIFVEWRKETAKKKVGSGRCGSFKRRSLLEIWCLEYIARMLRRDFVWEKLCWREMRGGKWEWSCVTRKIDLFIFQFTFHHPINIVQQQHQYIRFAIWRFCGLLTVCEQPLCETNTNTAFAVQMLIKVISHFFATPKI